MHTDNVHLLLIEDNAGYLEELTEWLEVFGYQHLETATNVTEAQDKLANGHFDVIIADMNMEKEDSGFAVLEKVKDLGISSVVIILTANDRSSDCRKAFKMGAWDYIAKNWQGNVFEIVHQSIQDAITYFNRWGNTKNEQWIEENLVNLEQEYWGQWIAVINQTVIEYAYREEELNEKIEERKLRRFLTTFKKIGDLIPITEIIQQGESHTLEFKSTLQWNVREDRQDKNLRFEVLRTIVAFLNSSDGGTLLIGVDDDGHILGLENDLSLLSKGDIDQFEQTLINLITERIGVIFSKFMRIRFETVEDKIVCVVNVRQAEKFALLKNKKGVLESYIRMGNTSRLIEFPQIYDYF
ncbi:MAG: response regulator [Microcystaceae cyanobacterium]